MDKVVQSYILFCQEALHWLDACDSLHDWVKFFFVASVVLTAQIKKLIRCAIFLIYLVNIEVSDHCIYPPDDCQDPLKCSEIALVQSSSQVLQLILTT